MLELSIENFLSFSERQTFNMYAGEKGNIKGSTFDIEYIGQKKAMNKVKLYKTAVLYGLNNSGKSNFVNALSLITQIISLSWKEGLPKKDFYFKLYKKCIDKPSFFSITFVASDKIKYEYSFSITKDRIWNEKLIGYPNGQPQLYFERIFNEKSNNYDYDTKNLIGNSPNQIEDIKGATRQDCLFLSASKQYVNDLLKPVLEFLTNKFNVLPSFILDLYDIESIDIIEANNVLTNNFKNTIFSLLDDKSIVDVRIKKDGLSAKQTLKMEEELNKSPLEEQQKIKDKYENIKKHIIFIKKDENGNDVDFGLDKTESEGTRKLVNLLGILYKIKENNEVLVFDELDCKLHPKLLILLLQLIYKLNWNIQLIFTAHNTAFLKKRFDVLRKYQVWFVEKDYDNVSSILYSAGETSVRNEKDLEDLYFNGRFIDMPKDEVLENLSK